MNQSLREQLSTLPIPSLTTVLRVDLALVESNTAFEQATGLIRRWLNEKANRNSIRIGPDATDFSCNHEHFKADLLSTGTAFALAMEEQDSSIPERTWIWDFALALNQAAPQFSIRGSYRQPRSEQRRPDPRTPRFLRDLLDSVGATDYESLTSASTLINSDTLPELMYLLESPDRTLPVIVISHDRASEEAFVESEALARLLAGAAHVRRLDFAASWALTREWGKEWSVFNGAVRCYNPRLDRSGDRFQHRSWMGDAILRMDAKNRNGFLNACVGHVFAQVTAQFESLSLLTPAMLRRQLSETPISQPPEIQPDGVLEKQTSDRPGATAEPMVQQPSIRESGFGELLTAKDAAYAELAANAERLKEEAVALERALEQERAGRAESEKQLQTKSQESQMWEEEVDNLQQKLTLSSTDVTSGLPSTLVPLWDGFKSFRDSFTASIINLKEQFSRLERDSVLQAQTAEELKGARDVAASQRATIESLTRKSAYPDTGHLDSVLEILPQLVTGSPTLAVVIRCISIAHPSRVTFLDTATRSAEESSDFLYGHQAFDLLWTLATGYWEKLQSKGDAEARRLFGNSYSPKESEKLSNAGRSRRTFAYNGGELFMPKHLKIGTADNSADTLRIHFEWIPAEKRFVIGHCGKHLNF